MTEKGPNGLSLNFQHDYITLKTPNGNFTVSWNGSKASGNLAYDRVSFNNLDKYTLQKSKETSMGDAMRSLLNPEVLTGLWSDWNKEVKVNDFTPGEKVRFIPVSLFAKKYPKGGEVKYVKKKNVFITLFDTNEVIGFDYTVLER